MWNSIKPPLRTALHPSFPGLAERVRTHGTHTHKFNHINRICVCVCMPRVLTYVGPGCCAHVQFNYMCTFVRMAYGSHRHRHVRRRQSCRRRCRILSNQLKRINFKSAIKHPLGAAHPPTSAPAHGNADAGECMCTCVRLPSNYINLFDAGTKCAN